MRKIEEIITKSKKKGYIKIKHIMKIGIMCTL